MITFERWIPAVLLTPILLATGHPSLSSPPVAGQASDTTPLSSSLPRPGFNAAAHSAGKLYFGTATNNYQLNDTAYVASLDDLAMFGQITPAKGIKWVRAS